MMSSLRLAGFVLCALLAGAASASAASSAVKYRDAPYIDNHSPGLGPVLFDAFGGGIFGWDMNQNGNDGLLSETVFEQNGFLNAIEIFDESTAKITKVVQKRITNGEGPEPVVEAVAGNDVGLIDDEQYHVVNGRIVRDDLFPEMNPVSGGKITGSWKPPHSKNLLTSFVTNNEASANQAVMALDLNSQGIDYPRMYLYDSASDVWSKPYLWPANQVIGSGLPAGYLLYTGVDARINIAMVGVQVFPYSEDDPPWFDFFDAKSGMLLHTLKGLGRGFINGMAIDSTTDIMCTTFQDMSVEFLNVSTGKGIVVQIPVFHGGGPLTNGAAVAVDPIHHLFLVAQLNSTFSPFGGSTVIVYDEHGKLIDAINGFAFLNTNTPVVVHIAVNPAARIGYVPGAGQGELQSFTY
jgi:hypothetical protein